MYVRSETAIPVPGVAVHSTEPRCRFAHFVGGFATTDTPFLQEHPVEMIRSPVANKVVRSSARKESRLIIGRVGNTIRCPGDGASVIYAVAKRKWADCDIVGKRIPHLITIFQVHIGATNIVQNIGFDSSVVGAMNNDPALLRIFDGVTFEETVWTIFHFVKMQTIFPFDTCGSRESVWMTR